MKRILSVVLVFVLALSLCTVAFASSEEAEGSSPSYGSELWAAERAEEGYSIYVENTVAGMTYNVYKLVDITEESDGSSFTVSEEGSLGDGFYFSEETFYEESGDVDDLFSDGGSILGEISDLFGAGGSIFGEISDLFGAGDSILGAISDIFGSGDSVLGAIGDIFNAEESFEESFYDEFDISDLIDEDFSIFDWVDEPVWLTSNDSASGEAASDEAASGEPASDEAASAEIIGSAEPYTTEVGNGGEMIVQVDDQGVYYITDADDLPVMLAVIVPTELSSDILTYFGLDSIIAEMEGASASGEMESVLGNIFNTDIMTEILDDFLGDVDMGSLNFSRLVYQDILSLYTTIPLSGNDFQLVIEVVGAEVNSVSAINPR